MAAAAGNRDKALDTALAQIERQFGKGSVMRLGDEGRAPVEVIPTGAIALDVALGIGGLPRGRVVEIYGPESSGKTTVALHSVASAQARGGIAAFIDAEHALDPAYAQAPGRETDPPPTSPPHRWAPARGGRPRPRACPGLRAGPRRRPRRAAGQPARQR